MSNAALADLFEDFARLVALAGGNRFKAAAYRRAAAALRGLREDVATLAKEDRLREVPGIGSAIEKKIREYLATGRIRRYEEARAAVPAGLVNLARVPGLGPETARRIHEALGIASLEKLEEAARLGRLQRVPGIGPRKEAALLRAVRGLR